MPAVIFHDGHRVEARTWRELERTLRLDPWNPRNIVGFRLTMLRRAIVWSGTAIHTTGTSRQFVRELERAGLLMIEEAGR